EENRMMTQSVMTQAANLFGNSAKNVPSKLKQTGNGFDLIIDSNLKSLQKSSDSTGTSSVKKSSIRNSDVKDRIKNDDTNANVEQTKTNQTKDATKSEDTKDVKQTSGIHTEQASASTKSEEVKDVTTEELTPDEQTMAQIVGMLQSIRNAVMEELNLTSEGLDQLLADHGMSTVDLLGQENLQQLVLANSGESNLLATLTDESLANTMKQLLQTVEGIKTEANMQLSTEQIKAILTKLELPVETQVQTQTSTEAVIPNEQMLVSGGAEGKLQKTNTVNVAEDDKEQLTTEKNTNKDNSVGTAKLTEAKGSDTGAQADANSNGSKELKAEDQFQTFVDNLVKVSQGTQVEFSGNLVQVTELRDIANQIIERIKVSIQPDQTSMELQLNPENLGKVNLSIQSKNGVLTAQFVVQNELSKEAIESQLHTLRETLNQQGIKVEAIEVTVSTYAFEQNTSEGSDSQTDAQKNRSGKQISLEDALNMTELSEEESNVEDITGMRGSQVDYTA
ncbi:MAG: flagellar hook-length control protein FliK, partial [Mobilitalea sp.]